eukprot:COSAG02_NODE_15575_length_1159_cov_1.092453_2_plen_222_part_00
MTRLSWCAPPSQHKVLLLLLPCMCPVGAAACCWPASPLRCYAALQAIYGNKCGTCAAYDHQVVPRSHSGLGLALRHCCLRRQKSTTTQKAGPRCGCGHGHGPGAGSGPGPGDTQPLQLRNSLRAEHTMPSIVACDCHRHVSASVPDDATEALVLDRGRLAWITTRPTLTRVFGSLRSALRAGDGARLTHLCCCVALCTTRYGHPLDRCGISCWMRCTRAFV